MIEKNQIPVESLPDGTIVKTTAFWGGLPFTHYGIIHRAWNGHVLVHHNSKKIGHAATTNIFDFSGGQLMYVDFVPQTSGEGWQIAQRARADVQRGVVWTVADNCEDMKSRALTGSPGSPTRNAFVGLSLVGIILILISRA